MCTSKKGFWRAKTKRFSFIDNSDVAGASLWTDSIAFHYLVSLRRFVSVKFKVNSDLRLPRLSKRHSLYSSKNLSAKIQSRLISLGPTIAFHSTLLATLIDCFECLRTIILERSDRAEYFFFGRPYLLHILEKTSLSLYKLPQSTIEVDPPRFALKIWTSVSWSLLKIN